MLAEKYFGVKIGGEYFPIVLFADDMCILSNKKIEMDKMIEIFRKFCWKWRLTLNAGKFKMIVFGNKIKRDEVFYYGDEIIENVKCHKMLGVWFDNLEGSWDLWKTHRDKIWAKGRKALGYGKMIFHNCKYISIKVLKQLWTTMMATKMTFMCEIFGERKNIKIEKIKQEWCRKIVGLDRWTNREVAQWELGWGGIHDEWDYMRVKLWKK